MSPLARTQKNPKSRKLQFSPESSFSPKDATFSTKNLTFNKKKKRTKKEMKVVGGHAMPVRDFSKAKQ